MSHPGLSLSSAVTRVEGPSPPETPHPATPSTSRLFGSRRSSERDPLTLRAGSRPWLKPRQWPSRPLPFPSPPTSSARRSSRARPSCTRVRRGGRPRARLRPAARARRCAAGDRRGREGPVDGMAAALLAHARPRARALRRRAQARRRHVAEPPPGRCAVGHADGAARRGPAQRRRRAGARCGARARHRRRRARRQRRRAPADDERRRARRRRRRRRGRRRRARGLSPLDIEIDDGDDDEDEDEDGARGADEDAPEGALDEDQLDEAPDDPNAHKRFWFEHATGAGKTVAAMGFVDASRTGGILILTHRRNLVDQFHGELKDRGYAKRVTPALLKGQDAADGPVTVETYQWFVRNAGNISVGLLDRHLRRGAHRAGREDERRDPRLDRPDLHRHDRDRRAHRAPRHRPLPDADLALRPRAGRPPRRHLAAALHAHPAGPGRAHDRQGAAAPRRGRRRVRPGDAGRAARPGAVQLRGRRPLQGALQRRARRRLRRRRAPRLQRRRRRFASRA